MRSDQKSQVGMVTLSGNCPAQWAWHDLERLYAVTAAVMGKMITAGMSPAPVLSPAYERGFAQSPSSPTGRVWPCHTVYFGLRCYRNRRKGKRVGRRRGTWLELEEKFMRQEFWKEAVRDQVWYAEK